MRVCREHQEKTILDRRLYEKEDSAILNEKNSKEEKKGMSQFILQN